MIKSRIKLDPEKHKKEVAELNEYLLNLTAAEQKAFLTGCELTTACQALETIINISNLEGSGAQALKEYKISSVNKALLRINEFQVPFFHHMHMIEGCEGISEFLSSIKKLNESGYFKDYMSFHGGVK